MKLSSYRLVLFLHYFALGILVPVLSMMLLAGGLQLIDLAFAIGAYSVSAAVLEVPTGVLADLVGKKKIYAVSLCVVVLSMVVILIGQGFVSMMIGIMLFGASRALASGSIEALFLDRYSAEFNTLSRGVRIVTISESSGLAVGSFIGGMLPLLSSRIGLGLYDLNLLLRIGVTVLIGILVLIFIPTDHPLMRESEHRFRNQIRMSVMILIDSRLMRLLFLVVLATGLTLNYIEAYWQPLFLSLIGNSGDASVWLGVLSVSFFGAVMLGNVFSDRISRKTRSLPTVYLIGRIGMILFLLLSATTHHVALFSVSFCMIYLCFGFANVAEGTMINTLLREENRASVLSMQSLVLQLGVVFGALLAKTLPSSFAVAHLWMIGAGALGLVLFPFLGLRTQTEAVICPVPSKNTESNTQ